jgi:hypothetical protein
LVTELGVKTQLVRPAGFGVAHLPRWNIPGVSNASGASGFAPVAVLPRNTTIRAGAGIRGRFASSAAASRKAAVREATFGDHRGFAALLELATSSRNGIRRRNLGASTHGAAASGNVVRRHRSSFGNNVTGVRGWLVTRLRRTAGKRQQ